jgi:hypothetical protein
MQCGTGKCKEGEVTKMARKMIRKTNKSSDEQWLIVDEKTRKKLFQLDVESREDYEDAYIIHDFGKHRNVFGTDSRGEAFSLMRHLESGKPLETFVREKGRL